jgi:hypothetical protein
MLVGMNTHFNYNDGKYNWYNDPAPAIEKLKWLGVAAVRDHVPDPGQWWVVNAYKALAAAGIKFSLPTGGDIAQTVANTFAVVPRELVLQFEGPNEPNNSGWSGDPVAYIRDLKAAVAPIPVAGICSWPVVGTPCDLANIHPYPRGGDVSPVHALESAIAEQLAVDPGRPVIVTETGYSTKASDWYGPALTEEQQANRIVEMLDACKARGVLQTYLYELLDDRPNAEGFGLWAHHDDPRQMKPKFAATAVRDWIARQAAPAPAPAPVTPSPAPTPPTPTVPAPEAPGTVVIPIPPGDADYAIDVKRRPVGGKTWKVAQPRRRTKGK